MKIKEILVNGLWNENPTFRLVLGMCPTLAVTTAAINGISMGLATTFVLICSNVSISLLRRFIPERIRIPAFVIVIATFVSIVEMLMKAYFPALYDALGLYISLIVVNCIIFARAESFAFKNPPIRSALDGLSMGVGFTLAITLLSIIRELIGTGKIFGQQIISEAYEPMMIATQAPGGFILLGLLLAVMTGIVRWQRRVEGLKR